MKSPKKNLKARSSVTSRKSSPGWTAATDLFKSPKSPSPVKRVTRRTSMYHNKKTVESGIKMPLSKIVSPPGVKTRARRSSIYQKGGGRLLSPKNTRTRRTSMYVSSKAKTDSVDVFSKVWATPMRPLQSVTEMSSEKSRKREGTVTKKSSAVKKQPKSETKQGTSTPKQIVSKTPRSTKKSARRKTPLGSASRSAKKSPKQASTMKSPTLKSSLKKSAVVITSTPTKSLEQISGKSFYATPGETPIVNERKDEVFVFSAMPVQSAKKTAKARKSVVLTPIDTPHVVSKTPKRMPIRKTPAVKRRRQNETDSSISSPAVISPVAKRLRASAKTTTAKSVRRVVKPSGSSSKSQMSPVQMTSVLKSVERVEKRAASSSPTPRPSKLARKEQVSNEQITPRVFRTVKRSSPKKLADIVSISQNTNNNCGDEQPSPGNITLLDDTINTDSRSSRCIIL